MACSECGDKERKPNNLTKSVIEINNPDERIILFRKVLIPASMGTEDDVPPAVGKYFNVLLQYEATGNTYMYSSDGIPTRLTTDVGDVQEQIDQLNIRVGNEIINRIDADSILSSSINSLSSSLSGEIQTRANADTALGGRLTVVEGVAATALQPADIDKVVMTDIELNSDASTTTVQIDAGKVNLMTGQTTTKNLPLPVASSEQAGVMNPATYDAISQNAANIEALLSGAVAITGLPASPTQGELTTAWETETGASTLTNRASIYDISNEKVWTYYTNTTTWYAASNTAQVSIAPFTNLTDGTILGSTNEGQVFAENDGTGSVNGWDTLKASVTDNTNKLAGIEAGAEVNVQSDWDEADSSADDYIKNKPIVPVITMTTTDPGEGVALAENHFIAVYST